MLAHIRDGKIIRRYPAATGWVDLADGRRVSPPVAGFTDGPDRIVALVTETIDNSTRAETVTTRETVVEKDRVLDRTVTKDVPRDRLVAEVKAEAGRRIEAIMPAYKQRNFFALQAELSMSYGPDPKAWPADMQKLAQEGLAAWAQIKAIRARSDEIEAMDPIPLDFDADEWWA